MVVWIASYPGSHEDIVPAMIYRKFGVPWYEANTLDHTDIEDSELSVNTGQRSAREKWRRFYEKALQSEKIVLARTRMPPSDEQPFVYISWNGANAIRSLYYQHQQSSEKASASSVILGDKLYPDWTHHYEMWKERPSAEKGCFVRIEDLEDDPDGVIDRIAEHCGIRTRRQPADSIEIDPATSMKAIHDSVPEWTVEETALYCAVHGASALERGYSLPTLAADGNSLKFVPFETIEKFVAQHRESIAQIGRIAEMSGYIDSLQIQLAEETERLRDYIEVLKNENSRRGNGG